MRVLAIFCAAFAFGTALAQYLLSAQWALILCVIFASAALIMGLCGCAVKRGAWAKRAFLCALGLALALGYNTLYAHFIKAPNDALLGTQDTVEVELLGYAEETSHGAKVTVKILNRGLPGRAIYYGDADLMDLEPGAHVTAEALFNSATDPTGKGLHLRNFTAKGVYILLYQRGEPSYDEANAGAMRYLPQRIARKLGETIEQSYGEREGAFLRALLLGDKKYLDEEDASNLSEVGLSHVMAVSGLHCCFSGVVDRRAHGWQAAKTPLRRDDPTCFSLCVCHGADAEHSARVHHDLDGHDRAASGARQRLADVHLVRAAAHSAQKPLCHREHQLAAYRFPPWRASSSSRRSSRRPCPRETQACCARRCCRFRRRSARWCFQRPLPCYYFGTLSVVSLLSNLLCLWLVSIVFALGLLSVI